MKNLQALAVLLVGFASGVASAALYLRSHPDRLVTDIPTRSEQLDAMADEVGLDVQQRASAHVISDRTHSDLAKLRESVGPQIATIRSDVRSQLRALMTPEQQVRFDAYCARRDAQRAHSDD